VLDPDLIRQRREPRVEITGTASAAVELPVADGIDGLVARTSSGGASFSWQADPGADFYVVEVTNALGQVVWGGFDANRRPLFRVLGGTEIDFGALVPAAEPLQSGRRYRLRVYGAIDTTTGTLFELVSASEELEGVFRP
jgi:hypothetical protein